MDTKQIIQNIHDKVPKSIYELTQIKIDGCSYRSKDGLVVIFSIDKEIDNNYWLHVSYSRKSRIPDYNDTTRIKKHFIGDDHKAIMIFPEKEKHVNLHSYCLHLWSRLDGDSLPDFSRGLGSI